MKHIVGFSGGIDSQAAARWVLNRFPADSVILLNANPGGNEHELTTEHIAWYSANVHPVVTVDPSWRDMWIDPEYAAKKGHDPEHAVDFADMASVRGRFPARRSQFCTELLKLRPSLRWIKANIAGEYDRYTGMRRNESAKRRETPPDAYDTWFDCHVHHVVFDWTKQMCFDFCTSHGEQVNALYALGFERVGCFPCINWSRDNIRNAARRFPESIHKVRGWEQRVGRTFFPPMVPGKEINWIDEVVEWANCERGGKQYSLDVMYSPPACESKFGLCE